jgi:hypothetical protein
LETPLKIGYSGRDIVRHLVTSLSIASAGFVAKFAELAGRLAAIDILVHTADLRWGSFGSFTLMVVKREEAVRFMYDGRDSYVTVDASPITGNSYPNQWKQLVVKGLNKQNDEVIRFVEDFLRTRFST